MIKRFLEYLGLCQHHWELFDQVEVFKFNKLKEIAYVQKCSKCGKCGKLHQFRVK